MVLHFQDFLREISKYNFRLNWISILESLMLNSCFAFDLKIGFLPAGSVKNLLFFLQLFSHMTTTSLYS
jgi:hypothetical protein